MAREIGGGGMKLTIGEGEVKVRDVKTFCNGTEYDLFMAKNCYRCKKYVDWQEATASNPVCPVEDNIGAAMFNESLFPSGFIKQRFEPDGTPHVPHCTELEEVVEAST